MEAKSNEAPSVLVIMLLAPIELAWMFSSWAVEA